MSDFSKAAADRIEALIDANWTDVSVMYRVSVGSWLNWRDQIKAGGITLPFAVLQALAETPDPDWGPTNKAYRQQWAVYYVRSAALTAGEKSGGAGHAEDLIYPKVSTLRDAVIANATSFQTIEEPAVDVGDTNPANVVFSENGDPYWAGSLTFWTLIGESYN